MAYDPTHYTTWETVSVPGICTFQIPPTMELQAGKFSTIMNQVRSKVLQITDSANRVVAQQKGLNSFDSVAKSRYARVIVETTIESHGYFNALGDPLALSVAEIEEVDAAIKKSFMQEFAKSKSTGYQTELKSWGGTRVVRVNGIDCFLTEYSRSVNNAAPAIVRMYKFMNNDRLHTISISYRTTESDMWAADLEKIITTFQFIRR